VSIIKVKIVVRTPNLFEINSVDIPLSLFYVLSFGFDRYECQFSFSFSIIINQLGELSKSGTCF